MWLKALKSRTTWTIVAIFIFNGLESIVGFMPDFIVPAVNAVLSLLAIYFRIHPRQ